MCDFGSSKIMKENSRSTPYVVGRLYHAPELILGYTDYNYKIDIFSVGCILCELFALQPLFVGEIEGLQIFEYLTILGKPEKDYFKNFNLPEDYIKYFEKLEFKKIPDFSVLINPNSFYSKKDIDLATDLILNMLNFDIDKRFSAEECLNHKFLKDVDIEDN